MSLTPRALQTGRLTGRPFQHDDWPLIHALQSDPRAGRFLLAPGVEPSEARSREIAGRFAECWLSAGFGPYLWRIGARNIGYAGLRPSRLQGVDEIEALWGVLPEYWGRGYATEAARAAIEADAAGPSVASWTLPENAASRRVMEKLGFVYEREAVWAGLQHVVYRLWLEGVDSAETDNG